MNNQKRRPFRPRNNKNGFRGRSNNSRSNGSSHYSNNNGNNNFNRNGSMTNPLNVEKTILKYQQLAKDAQSLGDPVVVENYLQHADHYSRRLSELNSRVQTTSTPIKSAEKTSENNVAVDLNKESADIQEVEKNKED